MSFTAYLTVFAFGAVIGSFLNVCIYRMPRNISVVSPPSKCTRCGAGIMPWDNIPVISWFLLAGRCRKCRTPISFVYPLVEALSGFLYCAALYRFGIGPDFAVYCIFLSVLVVITFIDFEFQIIPDRLTLPGIPIAILAGSFVLTDPFSGFEHLGVRASLIGAASGFIFYYGIAVVGEKIFRKQAMGGGDIKMMAMVGGILGWKGVLLTTFLGSLLGSAVGILMIALRGREKGSLIPFGPFLAMGALATVFFGREILRWYLG